MNIYGKEKSRIKKSHIDKGHFQELKEIAKHIMGEPSDCVPTLAEYYYAAVMPLKAIDSMKSNNVMHL